MLGIALNPPDDGAGYGRVQDDCAVEYCALRRMRERRSASDSLWGMREKTTDGTSNLGLTDAAS